MRQNFLSGEELVADLPRRRGDDERRRADVLADPSPRHAAEVEKRDPPGAASRATWTAPTRTTFNRARAGCPLARDHFVTTIAAAFAVLATESPVERGFLRWS
jgi:hypothetical protein